MRLRQRPRCIEYCGCSRLWHAEILKWHEACNQIELMFIPKFMGWALGRSHGRIAKNSSEARSKRVSFVHGAAATLLGKRALCAESADSGESGGTRGGCAAASVVLRSRVFPLIHLSKAICV